MAQQSVKINLLFDAQTSQAQKNIQQLGNLLHQISSKTTIGVDSGSLSEAVNAAQQLQIHLQNAVNVDTGKLDLMKLNSNLKSSGKTLQEYATSLTKIGPTGEQAFLRLAQAVSSAEVPVVKTNKVIKDFLQTLANTAKWQVASSAIHGIQGMLNSAVGHAKDLNKALTDIQIVTNYSTNYMQNFAESASKAAKALNTTTTEYAKAALIFYQQGLSGSAVEERASVVVKLSQVTGESAQKVSDQMTAIWNNFDDGSESLEYYADVLTKLGAATAASTSEISDGLEKFAAVAETVGLSYEYAAASVATVVDKTRQSADVVGTAFKTIFARMQGLSLGETLDDGVDLNKYSEALEKVGVDVLTADGELRDMDKILDDLGEKWQGLGEETQVALAQTVGGVRQYNQMMSLMNNWEDVHKNIDLAAQSTGELATQQKIWSASYEASVQKLEQAKNELYENFISDDLLIDFNDALTQIIGTVNRLIDRFGGMGPTLLVIAGIFSKTLFPIIGEGFKKLGSMISVWTGKAAKDVAQMQDTMSKQIDDYVAKGNLTEGMKEQMLLSQQILKEKQKLMQNSKNMSEAERLEAETRLALAEAMAAETSQLLSQKDALEKNVRAREQSILSSNKEGAKDLGTGYAIQTYQQDRDKNAPENEQEKQKYNQYTQQVIEGAQTQSLKALSTAEKSKTEELTQLEKTGTVQQKEEKRAEIAKQIAQAESTVDENGNLKERDEALAKQLRIQEEGLSRDIESQKNLEKEIQLLQDQLKLRREIVKSQMNPEDQKKGHVAGGAVTSTAGNDDPEEDSRDTASTRLHAEDTTGFETRANAESGRMQQIEASFGEGEANFDTSTQTMAIEASIANYEKLYATIGEQKVIQSELAAAMIDIGNVMTDTSQKSQSLIKAEEQLADAENALSDEEKALLTVDKNKLKSMSKFSPEYTKLSKAGKDYVKAVQNLEKAEKKQISTNTATIKSLKAAKDEYIALAKKAGLTDDTIRELSEAFDQLDESADNSTTLAKIQGHFGQLGDASVAVEADLQAMADNMSTALVEGGQLSGEAMEGLTGDLQSLANMAPATNASMKGTQDALGGVSLSAEGMLSKFSSGVSAIAAMGTQLFAFQQAIAGVADAFGEGGTAADKFQAILALTMTALPLITTMTELFAAAKQKETWATLKAIPAKISEFVTTKLLTAGLWAQVGAQLASLLSNPFTLALGLVAIAAIAGVIIMVNKQTKATEANTDANRALTESQREQASASTEQAKESAKLIDAWADQMGVMDGLIAKYKELEAAEKDSAEAAKDIIDAVPDMVDAYNDLAEKLDFSDSEQDYYDDLIAKLERAAEIGDIDAIEDLTYKLDKLMANKGKTSLDQGIAAAKSGIVSDIFTDAGVKVTSTTGRNVLAGGSSGIFIEDLDSGSVIKGMSDAAGLTASWSGGTKDGIEDGWLGFGLRTDTEENFVEDYEKMLQLYNDAQQKFDAATLADDKGFQALKKVIEATESTYNDYKGMIDTRLNTNIAAASLNMADANDLNNYDDYSKHRQAVFNKMKTANPSMDEDKLWEAVDNYFKENSATNLYARMDSRLKTLSEEGANTDEIKEYLQGLSTEDQKLFLNVDINKYQTKESIQAAIELARAEADKEKIEVRIEGINNIASALKEDMGAEDWQKIATDWENIQKQFSDAGVSGLIDFQEFLSMSYKEQSEYLEKIKLQQQQLLVAQAQNVLAERQQAKTALETDYQNSTRIDEIDAEILRRSAANTVYSATATDLSSKISQATSQGGWSSTAQGYADQAAANNAAWSANQAEIDALKAEKAQLEAEQASNLAQAEKDIAAAEQEILIQMQALENMEFEAIGLNGDEVREYADHLKDVSYESELVSEELATNEEAAKKVAAATMRMNKGVEALSEGMEEWKDVLENSDESSQEYAEALGDLREAMSDLLNVDAKFLSKDFLTRPENLALMEEAAKGSAEAIDELAKRAATDIVVQVALDKGLSPEEIASVTSKFEAMQNLLDQQDLKVGATADLDLEAFNGSLADLVNTTGMSVEEMQAAFNALGYEPVFETQPQEYTENVPVTETRRTNIKYEDPNNPNTPTSWQEQTFTVDSTPVTYTKQVPVLSSDGSPKIKSIIRTGSGAMNNSSGVNKGGNNSGGGGNKKLEKSKKSDMIDRYKEINDQLDTTAKALEKANREADSLWGPARIAKMKEASKHLERQNKLLKEKAKMAEDYLKNGSENDKNDLISTVKDVVGKNSGIDFSKLFDDNNNFVGYDEVMEVLWGNIEAAENAVKDPENVSEAEQAAIDAAKEDREEFLDALGIYDETRQTAMDAIADYEQSIIDIQQQSLDTLSAELELKISVDDSDLEKINFHLDSLDENIWDIGEKFSLMFGSLNEDGALNLGDESQLSNYMSKLGSYSAAYQELVRQYTTINPETGKTYINQAQFMEKLQELTTNIYGELTNLQELERGLRSAYSDTMAAVDEELAKHTATMEHHVSVLDHFSTLMDLMGQSKNYTALKAIAEGQAQVAAGMAKVSKETYEMKQNAVTDIETQMKAAGFTDADGNFDAYAISYDDMTDAQKILYDNWQAGVTAAQEAQDQMLADAEAWAEALKSVLETRLSELADILNKNLSGEFGSLDQLNLAMERKNSLQEEYLTTTNKIYETDKMMRTAQQEIDKTTNSVAKRRLKQFIEETEQLQNQNKLSQHELDIQQAKYDLLLAEIALEEAQNAKSTVRLQRDAEGNFGYVYTADQNKVADAEQKLADAQNSLYNIGLEGANDYAQKYADTVQEMNDEITALTEARMNGEITSEEEFQQRKDAIIAHYYEKLQNYSHLYQVSLDTDGRVIEDAWSTQFGNMTYETEKWMGYVKDYAGQATDAFKAYNDAIAPIADYTIGKDASLAASKTSEIVTNNQKIVEAITGEDGVLDAMELQLQGVSDIIAGYISMKDEIDKAKKAAQELAEETAKTMKNESDDNKDNDLKPEGTNPGDGGSGGDGGDGGDGGTGPQGGGNPPTLAVGSEIEVKDGAKWYANSKGGGNSGTAQDGMITIVNENSHGYHIKGKNYGSGWIKKTDIVGYDTGGYTGDWGGAYGKLAFLHKKELILHEGDTANLLSSMEVLERILQVLDLQTFNAQTAGLLSTPGFKDTGSSTIEQHIEINAEFPNATDRFEIEEAFKSMAQLASQYTNRK